MKHSFGLKCSFILWIFSVSFTLAQETPMKSLPLSDMSSFIEQEGNWFVVGEVSMNPNFEARSQAKERSKRRNRKKDKDQAVSFEKGEGILLNINTEEKNSQLITEWEHGDIELELDVMLPKGSNSGIYLQGRYEVQLFDSWGTDKAAFTDMGGIYRNWQKDPEKSYMGKAPLANAAKAPGLWQHLKISFRAPRFNADGEKIANALFERVELNGVVIHDNVQVPTHTGGPIEANETAKGPLMIQGDHGPVAFRNINYKLLEDSEVELEDIEYATFYGNFNDVSQLASQEAADKGKASELTWQVVQKDSTFGIQYKGVITIPEDANYEFKLTANNRATFSIDGKEIVKSGGRDERASVQLKEGSHPFELAYIWNVEYRQPRLGLTVESEGTHEKELHSSGSFPQDFDVVPPIHVEVGNEPRLLRAFLDFRGEDRKRLTHTIAVGDPTGLHYIYDLTSGTVAVVWRGGRFINATSMWYSRGDGSFDPFGLQQYLFTGPSVAQLDDEDAAFPEEAEIGALDNTRYELDEAGRPVFKYDYNDLQISDKIYPDETTKRLIREVAVEEGKPDDIYFKLVEAETITKNENGTYEVDGQYYIRLLSSEKPEIREINGKQELIAELNDTPLKYSIIW